MPIDLEWLRHGNTLRVLQAAFPSERRGRRRILEGLTFARQRTAARSFRRRFERCRFVAVD